MRINSNMFLISYALFLFICLILVTFNLAGSYINDLITGISVVSALISFAELFYTKTSIDRNERIQLTLLYNWTRKQSEKYFNGLLEKFGEQGKRAVELYFEIFNEDERNIIENDIDKFNKEKDRYLNKINDVLDNEEDVSILASYINSFCDEGTQGLVDEFDYDKSEEKGKELNFMLGRAKKKEHINLSIANVLIIIGFTFLLITLTVNAVDNIFKEYTNTINNSITIFAFFSVILNLLLKDNYKARSLNEIQNIRKELIAEYKQEKN